MNGFGADPNYVQQGISPRKGQYTKIAIFLSLSIILPFSWQQSLIWGLFPGPI